MKDVFGVVDVGPPTLRFRLRVTTVRRVGATTFALRCVASEEKLACRAVARMKRESRLARLRRTSFAAAFTLRDAASEG